MENLEKQLNNLPKAKLGMRADLKIKSRLYFLIWRQNVSQLFTFESFSLKRMAVATAVLLLVIMTAVPAYAYASSSVARGNILYPLKQLAEEAELSLNKSATKKVATYEKIINRRLAEAEYLSNKTDGKNNDNLTATINEAITKRQIVREILNNLATGQATASAGVINQAQIKQQARLIKVAQNVSLKGDERVVDVIARAFNSLPDQDENEDQNNQSNASGTSSEPVLAKDDLNGQTTATKTPDIKRPNLKPLLNRYKIKSPAEINQVRKNINDFVETLKAENLASDEMDSLRAKLNAKIDKANQALIKGDYDQAGEFINQSDSLTKNARFFIKPKPAEINNKRINKNNDNRNAGASRL